jgi:hypothetical protein
MGNDWIVALLAAALALAAVLGIVWQFRARAVRRFRAVLDAYAERESRLLRAGRGKARV